jgi:hypothetical protein
LTGEAIERLAGAPLQSRKTIMVQRLTDFYFAAVRVLEQHHKPISRRVRLLHDVHIRTVPKIDGPKSASSGVEKPIRT